MYLLDTDFIIASRFPQESTYRLAKTLAKEIYSTNDFLITELVLMEVATVISRKYSQVQAVEAVKTLKKAPNSTLALSKEDIADTLTLFGQQKKRGTSMVDCSNVIIARKLKCKIISFDTFYKDFGLLVDL